MSAVAGDVGRPPATASAETASAEIAGLAQTVDRAIPAWQWVAAALCVAGLLAISQVGRGTFSERPTSAAVTAAAVEPASPRTVPSVPSAGGQSGLGRAGDTTSMTSRQAAAAPKFVSTGPTQLNLQAGGPGPAARAGSAARMAPVSEAIPLPPASAEALTLPPSTAGADVLRAEQQLLSLVNNERVANGLEPLANDSTLDAVARWRSEDMAGRGYFSHDIGGYFVFDALKSVGYSYRVAGENLAYNYVSDPQSVSEAHAALMRSPGHRDNILGQDFTSAGIGLAKVPDGRRIYTELFAAGPLPLAPASGPVW